MHSNNIDALLQLIRGQFSEKERLLIHADTDIKQLSEWTSLQTMIIVNEIDKNYGVILNQDDLQQADTLTALLKIIESKRN